jgi:hypothetical protein
MDIIKKISRWILPRSTRSAGIELPQIVPHDMGSHQMKILKRECIRNLDHYYGQLVIMNRN